MCAVLSWSADLRSSFEVKFAGYCLERHLVGLEQCCTGHGVERRRVRSLLKLFKMVVGGCAIYCRARHERIIDRSFDQ